MRSRTPRLVARLLPVAAALAGTALLICSHVQDESIKSYMVMTSNGLDPERTRPRLVRRVTYSSRYKVQPQRGGQ